MSISNVHREDFCFTSLWILLLCATMKSTILIYAALKKTLSVCIFSQVCLCMHVFSKTLPVPLFSYCNYMFVVWFVPLFLFPCICLTCMDLLVLVLACLYLSSVRKDLPVSAHVCLFLPVSARLVRHFSV